MKDTTEYLSNDNEFLITIEHKSTVNDNYINRSRQTSFYSDFYLLIGSCFSYFNKKNNNMLQFTRL